MPMKLNRVIRLDSVPLDHTYFTPEGYLKDRPILTSTGIFEYSNPDGSIRRELRLPEEVFDKASLESYKGKPIIITHDAGVVSKDNVHENQIGTILTDGFRDGDNVRADIIIHDTDEMKASGLRELSLGYNLDLDETPGEWNGQRYDAIQRNIRINHLAIVREARAGEKARLNIDSRETTLKGGKANMSKRQRRTAHGDGILSPEELKKAIADYKAKRAAKTDEDDVPDDTTEKKEEEPVIDVTDGDDETTPVTEDMPVEDKIATVKENVAARDAEGDPEDLNAAKETIAHQDEDISVLFDIIDTLLAQSDFDKDGDDEKPEGLPFEPKDDEGDDTVATDGEGCDPDNEDCDNTDGDDDDIPNMTDKEVKPINADSVDRIVRDRIKIGIAADMLNMDGIDSLGIIAAKKAVIRTARPNIRLDGKSRSYVNAMFDMVYGDIRNASKKDTNYQRRQMFNGDSARSSRNDDSSMAARQRMIERRQNREKEDK